MPPAHPEDVAVAHLWLLGDSTAQRTDTPILSSQYSSQKIEAYRIDFSRQKALYYWYKGTSEPVNHKIV